MRSAAFTIGVALTLSLAPATTHADPAPGAAVVQHTLDNGLTVLVKVDRRAPVAVNMVWYGVGSLDESNGVSGVSHVLEHMMFKGTQRVAAGDFAKIIARAGGNSNAFTSKDYTAYYQRLHRSKLALALELEADRMANLKLAEEEFAKEIRVVMEERRQRTEDNPKALVYEQLLANAFIANPYRNPIIGWMNDLQDMRPADLKAWYEAWYAPNNAILVVAGDVDPREVFALAQRYFGPIPSRSLPPRKPQQEPEQKGIKRIVVKAPAEQPFIAMAYKAPALRDIESDWEPYALYVLSGVLDGYSAARLSRELVRRARVADSIDTSYEGIKRGPGVFLVSATPAAGKTTEDVERAWREQLRRLVEGGVDGDELRRVKVQVVSDYVFKRDSVFSQASEIGRLRSIGLPHDAAQAIVRRLQQVTAEQVREVARKYLIDDSLTVAVLDPQPMSAAPVRSEPKPADDQS